MPVTGMLTLVDDLIKKCHLGKKSRMHVKKKKKKKERKRVPLNSTTHTHSYASFFMSSSMWRITLHSTGRNDMVKVERHVQGVMMMGVFFVRG